jgi:hypothetical protein
MGIDKPDGIPQFHESSDDDDMPSSSAIRHSRCFVKGYGRVRTA